MKIVITVASYLAQQFVHRLFEFMDHWYWGSFQAAGGAFMDLLADWDKFFALKITIRHWHEPLYQDRTFIGYILGPIFRTGRIIVGASVYLAATAAAVFLYLLWLIIPLYVVYRILTGFFNF